MLPICVLFVVAITFVPSLAWPQGEPVGPEFRVNTTVFDFQRFPSVARTPSGEFVAVWGSSGQDGDDWGIFGQRFADSGAPLGPEFQVNTYITGSQNLASVATDPSGNFVVVWVGTGQDGSLGGVFAQRYAASGAALGPEFRVNTYTTGDQRHPAAAYDPQGNLVLAWSSEQAGSGRDAFARRYDSTGAPLGPEFRVNTFIPNNQWPEDVSCDSSGGFVIVWSGSYDVFGQRYASTGAPLGPEFRINTYTTSTQMGPSIASDTQGNFVVVWLSIQSGTTAAIFGQRYAAAGQPAGPEFRVSTFMTSSQVDPDVAADPSGNFVVVWTGYGQDGSVSGVFGQRYGASGAPLGPEFRVNDFTPNGQNWPSVAADAPGKFVVVWASLFQDGSYYGIYGQRYGMIVPVELMRFQVE